jgi:hypothetical protein
VTALRPLAALLVGAALAACGTDTPPSTPSAPSPTASTRGPAPSQPAASPAASVGPGIGLGEPGRPYAASDLLDAMRDSRRPGGVPAELQLEAIAADVADHLWTMRGEPWTAVTAGGSCGPTTCTLELSGSVDGSSGEDAWVFAVDPGSGSVEVVTADLHAVPDDIAIALDRLARELDRDDLLDGLLFTSVRWLPPPDEDRFRLAYRSGDEEGSCSVDLELDAVAGRITDVVPSGC